METPVHLSETMQSPKPKPNAQEQVAETPVFQAVPVQLATFQQPITGSNGQGSNLQAMQQVFPPPSVHLGYFGGGSAFQSMAGHAPGSHLLLVLWILEPVTFFLKHLQIEKLKDADILTIAFEELGKFSPTLMETLITERDLFMTAALQKFAEQHSLIVAVVGRGHVAGITKYWGQDIPIHNLLEIPQKRSLLGLRLRTYILIILAAFASFLAYVLR
ncbi:hypothetical protein L7F22_045697 [Adiantum nelumboides]|nr:hypothetical protein [Adiantum nelumboides]